MDDFELEVNGTRVVIDFARCACDAEAFADRIKDILPILRALVTADNSWHRLTDDERSYRQRSRLAMEMKLQAYLLATKRQADLVAAVIEGSESISSNGFPEFEGTDGDGY